MTYLVSEATFNKEQAVQIAINSIEKKGLAFWEPTRKVVKVYEEKIREVYFPYFIMDVIYKPKGGVIKAVETRQLMAMEGITGEVGAVAGVPVAKEMEVDDAKIMQPRFTEDEVDHMIIDYMERYFVRTRRIIPVVLAKKLFLIYKPAYLISLDFELKGKVQHCRKVVDAESGYLVYRYDFRDDV